MTADIRAPASLSEPKLSFRPMAGRPGLLAPLALRGLPATLLALAAEHRLRHRRPARTKLLVPRLERRDPVAQPPHFGLQGGVLHAQGHDRGALPRIDAGLREKPAQPRSLPLQGNGPLRRPANLPEPFARPRSFSPRGGSGFPAAPKCARYAACWRAAGRRRS